MKLIKNLSLKRSIILAFLFVGMITCGCANPAITDVLPANNTKTVDVFPTFSANVTGNDSKVMTYLYIDDSLCGSINCTNASICEIVSTCGLSVGVRQYYLNSTDTDGTTMSGLWNIEILGGLEKVVVVVNDTIPIFGAVTNVIIGVFKIILVVVIIGFILGVIINITDAVKTKFGK